MLNSSLLPLLSYTTFTAGVTRSQVTAGLACDHRKLRGTISTALDPEPALSFLRTEPGMNTGPRSKGAWGILSGSLLSSIQPPSTGPLQVHATSFNTESYSALNLISPNPSSSGNPKAKEHRRPPSPALLSGGKNSPSIPSQPQGFHLRLRSSPSPPCLR